MKKKVVMTFGTFDMFHPGHRYYLSEARKEGDVLVVIVARDITVEKLK
jgi:FAD synthetase